MTTAAERTIELVNKGIAELTRLSNAAADEAHILDDLGALADVAGSSILQAIWWAGVAFERSRNAVAGGITAGLE